MNAYKTLNITPTSTILETCYQYQALCLTNPSNIFAYTEAFSLLINPFKRLNYDATLYQINIFLLSKTTIYDNIKVKEEEEYELANFIAWLEDFREYFYDSKFYYNNSSFLKELESWYDKVESILEDLKKQIHSFYLA